MRLPDSQQSHVAEAFDAVAASFESRLENDVTRTVRQRLYGTIEKLIPTGSSVLDINCGVGIDAVELARRGYRVAGADISPGMIAQARLRAQRSNVNVEFVQTSFDDLSPFNGRRFDLVLSNFGGFNCVASLRTAAERIATLTQSGGFLVAVVMPPFCLWEFIAGLARLSPALALRRRRNRIPATGFYGMTFDVYYHPPRKLIATFRESFHLQSIQGINIVSPPPHATRFSLRHVKLSDTLRRIDDVIATLPLLRAIGDHYEIIFRRKDSRRMEGQP